MSPQPKVSVITVNFNMVHEIAGTLDSILGQDYSNFESIVIDGGSTDGSREIIAAYGLRLGHWVSERDRNLYDAMNKGVAAATGEWVLFMNAGDRFAAPNVLSRIFATAHQGVDILYGDHIRRYSAQEIEIEVPAESPEVLPLRMHCSHQAMLTRRHLLVNRPFALDLLVADYDAIFAAYIGGKRFERVDCVVAVTTQGGRSDNYRFRALTERIMLVRRNNRMTPAIGWYYTRQYFRTMAAAVSKTILPVRVVSSILRHRPSRRMG